MDSLEIYGFFGDFCDSLENSLDLGRLSLLETGPFGKLALLGSGTRPCGK